MRSHLPQRVRNRRTDNTRNPPYYKLEPSTLAYAILSVALTLLVTLMTIPSVHHGSWVDLARVEHPSRMPGAIRDDAMKITVSRDGAVYFRNVRRGVGDLPQVIRDSVKSGAEHKVYLVVDSRARWSDVEVVLDEIRLSNIKTIGVLAEAR